VLGRDLEIAADMMRHEFLDVGRALDGEVVAHAGRHHDLLDAGQLARLAVEMDQRLVARVEVGADACKVNT